MTYTKRDSSISMKEANWYGVLITLSVVILLALVYLRIWGLEHPWGEVTASAFAHKSRDALHSSLF